MPQNEWRVIKVVMRASKVPGDPENKFYIPQSDKEQLLVITFEVQKGLPHNKEVQLDIDGIKFCYITPDGKRHLYPLLEIFSKAYIALKHLYEGTEIETWYPLNIAENAINPPLVFRGIRPIKDLPEELLNNLRTQKEKRILGEIIAPELEIKNAEPAMGGIKILTYKVEILPEQNQIILKYKNEEERREKPEINLVPPIYLEGED